MTRVLRNAILWGNTADNGSQIYIAEYASTSVTYSIVEGGWTGTGNLDVDPQFVDAPAGDLHLQSTSPAIDSGNNEVVPVSVTTDLDGYPRFVDYPPEGGTGYGTSPFVDMGAYEAQTGFDLFLPLVGR